MTIPLVHALADALAADILAGRLAPGTVLPTHRELASRHGLALASATKVYARLKAQGLVVGETGRGTFVRDRPPQPHWDGADEARLNASTIDLSFNHPSLPGQAELLRDMLRKLAGSGDLSALMQQQPPGGRLHERRVVAGFLARTRGITVPAEHVFLVNGAQQGLDVAARAVLQPGDAVAVDALTYPGFKMLAQAQRLSLQPVPCAAEGPDLDALDALCLRGRVRAIYAMPTLHNPLGWVLDGGQRQRLVDIARRHDCFLIEDAAYAFLAAKAPPALAAMAPERTLYVSSLSKSLATGLRFGFIAVPEACATKVKAHIRASHWSLPSVITAMATRWIEDGTVMRLEAAHRRDARRRQAVACEVFSGMEMVANPAALFVWLTLPPELRMDRITMALAARNIAVSKAEAYAATRHAPHALRLGLSSVPLAQLKPVLQQVRETIERFPV
ncbi:GntR family transcriptional regulator [Bordetella ansorpii]|uniref:GntR family transcriptional regulator n=1 Tax=Bordetella ansorpii TaxID=288768 RepID=A0A157PQC4_9BORD|nr:PLP-dependent aminotransferase family protein [Bordetella ansorpii]SAI35757.1 GntR family transcriptional regulator [Bordetella ansorpii]